MKINKNYLILFFIFFLFVLSSLYFFFNIVFKIKAQDNTVKFTLRIQGEYKKNTNIPAKISVYDSEKLLLTENVNFTSTGTENYFSALLDKSHFSIASPSALLIKPENGLAKIFCDVAKISQDCTGPNIIIGDQKEIIFTKDLIPLGDTAPSDGIVNGLDLSRIKENIGKKNTPNTDLNHDGVTDTQDFSLALYSVSKSFVDEKVTWLGKLTPTPSPTPKTSPTPSPTPKPNSSPTPTPISTATPTPTNQPSGGAITKKVMLVIYNPVLTSKNNQTLTQYESWTDPLTLTNQTIDWFKNLTNGKINYSIVDKQTINEFPVKDDGYRYNEITYLSCLNSQANCHSPDTVNYINIIGQTSACDKFNQGTIDELWLFGGPWFGYYESRLTGTGSFEYNSPPLNGTSCTKPMPIMGFSYERGMNEMVHDFAHRTEATMTKVYGSSAQNNVSHSWNKFTLVKQQSPNYAYSGCGSTHFAPNSTVAYEYTNTQTVSSYCEDFLNYPDLKPLGQSLKQFNCNEWSCTDIGYYSYWFKHLPKATGTAPDGKLSDWWQYIMNPKLAI